MARITRALSEDGLQNAVTATEENRQKQSEYHRNLATLFQEDRNAPTVKEFNQQIADCFLEPKGARLVIIEDTFEYKGRLYVPETAKRRPTTGRILKIGIHVDAERFRVGERVVYAQFSGTLLTFENKPAYRVLSEDEILAEILDDKVKLSETSVE